MRGKDLEDFHRFSQMCDSEQMENLATYVSSRVSSRSSSKCFVGNSPAQGRRARPPPRERGRPRVSLPPAREEWLQAAGCSPEAVAVPPQILVALGLPPGHTNILWREKRRQPDVHVVGWREGGRGL